MELLIVGGGRMGEALLGGLLAAGRELAVAEVSAARREELAAAYPDVEIVETPIAADGAVLVVKPGDVAEAARAVADAGAGRILSVAAGVTTRAIEEAAGRTLPVVRAMPNTPALVRAGAAAISPGSAAGEDDLAWAEEILGAVGVVVRVPETQLDAVTGLSGSGPAYVFVVAEAMAEAGVLAGLPRADSRDAGLPDAARRGAAARRGRRQPRGAARGGHLARRDDRRRAARARAPRGPSGVPRGGDRGGRALTRARRVTNHQIRLAARPSGIPKPSDWELTDRAGPGARARRARGRERVPLDRSHHAPLGGRGRAGGDR